MKISVIIPVYNVEKYIEDCLNSILVQTLKDFEIICIDDCSTDNSLQIIETYTHKDKRIKILKNKKNEGPSYTRNIGIEMAQGEYIYFLDSDDMIEKNALQELLTPQAIINAWNSITSGQVEKPEPEVPVQNVRVIDRSKVTIGKEDPSVEFTHSFSTPLERQRVEAQVVKDIVKNALYDIDTKTSINSVEKINGHTLLNRNLFEYQKMLLNNVRKYVGLNPVVETIDELTDDS